MASNCEYCSSSDSDLLETLGGGHRSRVEESLQSCLSKEILSVNVGAGCVETLPFDEANKRYLDLYFPDLDENTYCCPLVKEYKHPRETLEFGARHISDGTLLRERRGELAEERAVEIFSAMFKKYDIPSFIIHGYEWKGKYLKAVSGISKKVSKLAKSLFKLTGEGEMDLLIALPSKCLFAVEVKAVAPKRPKSEFSGVVTKAFSQCAKMIKFLSKTTSLSGRVCIVKIVVLPNCTRAIIGDLYCVNCRPHIVASDDLHSVASLKCWFDKIMRLHCDVIERFQLQSSIHSDIIGRLIGPASLTRFNTTSEAIQRTVDQVTDDQETLDNIQEQFQWSQMRPEQLSVKLDDPQFLLVHGMPGSGKTLLALSKAEEILRGNVSYARRATGVEHPAQHVENNASIDRSENGAINMNVRSVLYILVGMIATDLKKMYEDKLQNVPKVNCELIIEEDIREDLPDIIRISLRDFLQSVKTRKARHPGKIVHFLYDECIVLPDIDFGVKEYAYYKSIVNPQQLGFMWLIMDSVYLPWHTNEGQFYAQTGFHSVYLNRVMRMSKQNTKFVSTILPTISDIRNTRGKYTCTLNSGHAISGPRPSVYRMKCICPKPRDDFSCHRCSLFRFRYLTKKVEADLKVNCVALLMKTLFEETQQEYNVKSSLTYRGCEDQVVIIELSSLLEMASAINTLTRSTGKIVILDTGSVPKEMPWYTEMIEKLNSLVDSGQVEMEVESPAAVRIWMLGAVIESMSQRNKLDEMD